MKVLLTALSAKHIHKSLAPWCLKAYCDTYVQGCQVTVQEHTVNDPIGGIVEELYLHRPDVVGFSCYIWNMEQTAKVAQILKKYLPDCIIVLGGPEVSFEVDLNAHPYADYIVQGVGEQSFASLLKDLIDGKHGPKTLIKSGDALDLNALPSPYSPDYYKSFAEGRMSSIQNQLVYYESSRGCPFSCAYCLSSTFQGVQELSLERVFADITGFLEQGATCIKFVDRTFNANRQRALEILRHIFGLETDCTFHFEVAADLFNPELLALIAAMPPGRVQFEIGIQSTTPITLAEIKRPMDVEGALANIRTLVGFGNCHIHVDLIAGLPFDTPNSFAKSIDACIDVRPQMLQLGFLKLLKGTKLRENSSGYGYVFNDFPPYEVFQSRDMSFADLIKLRGIEAVIDKFYNSGAFVNAINYAIDTVFGGAYAFFDALADCCAGANLRMSPKNAYTLLWQFLCKHGDRVAAEHHIKLDCLTFHTRGVLPDEIPVHRDKGAEQDFRRSVQPWYSNVRIEFFEYDKKTRAFVYDEKDEMTQAHKVVVLME